MDGPKALSPNTTPCHIHHKVVVNDNKLAHQTSRLSPGMALCTFATRGQDSGYCARTNVTTNM